MRSRLIYWGAIGILTAWNGMGWSDTIPPSASSTTTRAPAGAAVQVRLGIDLLEEQGFAALKGKQVGLITNQTGVNFKNRSTADILARAPGVKLVALFSPEHGIRGNREHGQPIGDTIDPKLHLPVYSLYGSVQKPTPEMLNAIDVLVFDMQDVGTRFYTYLTTMGMAMEAASQRGIEFVVLDRPNPLGGAVVEGQVLDTRIRHFTAYYSVPVRHGFTAGELAQWYREHGHLSLKLSVIPLRGWKRDMFWPETHIRFVPPSPNIKTPTGALLYSGIGMFEATNLAVGRGTSAPFQIIGAPWLNGTTLLAKLKALKLPGFSFSGTLFIPDKDIYEGQSCSGVRIDVTDPKLARPVDLFVHVACILREFWPKDFQPRWDEVARVTGSVDFEKMYTADKKPEEIIDLFHKSAEQFEKDRQSSLLY